MGNVDVVLANNDRVTLRVGDLFLKVDADRERAEREAEALTLAPVPTPEVRWHRPPVLALAALRGRPLGRLGEPSAASPEAWAAVGAALRILHDAPLPPWPAAALDQRLGRLADECAWLVANEVVSAVVVARNRALAEQLDEPASPVFIHGDLHIEHVFVDGDEVTGIIDWSEAAAGDALFDLATLTLGHDDHLDDLLAGYGTDVDRDRIRAWRALRCLTAIRWLAENGYGRPATYPEVAVLRAQAGEVD